MPGERAVANYDEDSITMAVAAVLNLPRGVFTADFSGSLRAGTNAIVRA